MGRGRKGLAQAEGRNARDAITRSSAELQAANGGIDSAGNPNTNGTTERGPQLASSIKLCRKMPGNKITELQNVAGQHIGASEGQRPKGVVSSNVVFAINGKLAARHLLKDLHVIAL